MVVVGATGFLGRALVRAASARGVPVLPAGREVDVPAGSTVVNAAGLLSGDAAELRAANAELPAHLALLCLRAGAALLHVGSAAEYGEPVRDLVRESDPESPLSPYGGTKLDGTQAVRELAEQGLVATVARVFNVVGGYDLRTDPVSEFATAVRAVEDGGAVAVRDASVERDLAGVDWVAARLLDLAGHVGAEPVVNVCTGRGTSFGEVVTGMARQLGKHVTVDDGRAGGLRRVVGDPARLHRLLGDRANPEPPDEVMRVALLTEAELTSAGRG